MPNSVHRQKTMRKNEEARDANRAMRSAMRTAIRRVNDAVSAENGEEAKTLLAAAMKRIDKCAKLNIVHANNAARKKSLLVRRVNALG